MTGAPVIQPAGPRRVRIRPIWVCFLLVALCLVVYNANLRVIGAGDTVSARYLPFGILRYGTLTLDPIARWVAHGRPSVADWNDMPPAKVSFSPHAYWMVRGRGGHLVSFYPVVAPLLVTPLYLPAVAYLNTHGWKQPEVDWIAELMEKLAASLLATLAVVMVYLVLQREGAVWSLILALAFAFGTNTWMISSQALWQHGAGEFLIALALLLAVINPTAWRTVALGAVCVLIAANRPPDALFAGAIGFHALITRRRFIGWLVAGGAIPLAALLAYNLGVVGNFAGGYGTSRQAAMSHFQSSTGEGIAGLFVSPTRGLLIFSPFLIFVPFGLWRRLRNSETRILALVLSAAAILQVCVYARMDWRAGASWGPRYLCDMLPVLVWLLAPAALALHSLGRAVLLMAMAASIGIQAIGAFWYTHASDLKIFAGDITSLRNAWDFGNVPFLSELHHERAPGDLLCNPRCVIDNLAGVHLSGEAAATPQTPALASGAVIEGWALACGRVPGQLVLSIDGLLVGSTDHFFIRPDVDAAMHTNAPSGWSIVANTHSVPPGPRLLQVALRLAPASDARVVYEQPVIVVPTEPDPASEVASATALEAMAKRAAAAIRQQQRAEGYWLTSFTSGTQFTTPGVEMNTFLTAMMIDFLGPIARKHDLVETVERARAHLTAQIESDGLVRYHGLPTAPTIGTLGAPITPDSDDTALAWRIRRDGFRSVRPDRMLQELAAYRDSRGLYRTWLAPREKYQALDPGRDPNPVDATIQMHVYLMLAGLNPPAAKQFCSSLQRAIGDENLWVYYAKAPLIPYLRSAELSDKGCALPLPDDRLQHCVEGQEVWSELARRLVAAEASPPGANDRQALWALLARLGGDDFAMVRQTPPLLYHNDLTATVPRFYWSEDFGYALWLRAYEAALSGVGAAGEAR